MNEIIRLANISDSNSILLIYSPYIENTAVSFEIETPAIEEFADRISKISEKFPYLVYCVNGNIIAYAYASKHAERAAYNYDVDLSIYVLPQYHGRHIATKLYSCLFEILKEQGFYNAYASYTEPNIKSKCFHEKFGFSTVGTYHKVGYKFDKWHDLTCLEKNITDYNKKPKDVKNIKDLSPNFLSGIFGKYTITASL